MKHIVSIRAVIKNESDKNDLRDMVKTYLKNKEAEGKIESWDMVITKSLEVTDTEQYSKAVPKET